MQKDAATTFGSVVDIQFPIVDPKASENDLYTLMDELIEKINVCQGCVMNNHVTVMPMGELSLTVLLTNALIRRGYIVVFSTSERKTSYDVTGKKISDFQFIQFRKISLIPMD